MVRVCVCVCVSWWCALCGITDSSCDMLLTALLFGNCPAAGVPNIEPFDIIWFNTL